MIQTGACVRDLRLTSASALALTVALMGASAAHAQAKAQPATVVDEVVVTGGYAESLERASQLKRKSDVVIDAISAEDVGKFPSRNIGEALQRVPGVTLDRTADGSSTTRGEGVHINIRGLPPNFQNVQLNGRNIAVNEAVENGGKDGRQFRFDVLPSDIVSMVEVVKTESANLEEGGISGNVDVRTYRPLDVGSRVTLSAKGSYGQLADKLDGSYSGLASWSNAEGTFGALISGSYSTRHARQDRVYEQDAWLTGRDTNLFPNKDTFEPVRARPTLETEDRKRYTIAGSVQFKPNDDFETNIDGLWTRLNSYYKEYGLDIFLQQGSLRPGSFTVDADHTAIKGIMDNVQLQLSDETSLQRHTLYSIGINQAWTPGPWSIVGDVNFSRADSETAQPIERARFVTSCVAQQASNPNNPRNPTNCADPANATKPGFVSVAFDFSNGDRNPPTLTPLGVNLLDPTLWTTINGSIMARPEVAYDTDLEAKLDIARTFEGLIDRVSAGASYQRRVHDYWRIDRNAPASAIGITPAAAGAGSVNPLPFGDFLKGFNTSGYPTTWLDPNHKLLFDKFFYSVSPALLSTPSTAADLLNQSHLTEDILAGYAMAAFKGELAGLPYSGNVGLRVASARQVSTGYALSGTTATPVQFKKDYTDVMPSFNLKVEVTKDLLARFAVSKAISRPDLSLVAPGLSLATDVNNGGGGNPNLDPFRSTNYDVSVEWYFNRFGKLSVAGFVKDFDSYITAQTTLIDIPGSKFGSYNITTSVNGGTAKLSGLEFGYQQRFDFLPAPFDGLGAEASYTYVTQNSSFTTGNRTVKDSLVGVSKGSYNVVAFYEKGPVAARLGYFWRDRYLARLGPANGTDEIFDAFGSLDGSASYAVTDKLNLTFEALNLLDDSVYTYASVKSRPQEIFHYGRTFSASARYRF